MKINSIQLLRGVAALLVVYVHSIDLQMQYSVSKQQNFYHLQNFGAIGVDLFFVISGFIITYVAHQYVGPQQGIQFLTKRFVRINPIYYISSVLCFGIYALQFLISGKPVPDPLDKTLSSLADTILILPASGAPWSYAPLLTIGWTLSFEWMFYLLFFLLIVIKIKHKVLPVIGLVMGLVVLGYLSSVPDYRFVFLTNPILLEFLLGIVICWLYLNVKVISVGISLACLLIGIASYVLLVIKGFGLISEMGAVLSGQGSMKRFLIWGLPSAFIVAGCIFLEKNGRFLNLWNNRWMLLTGNASYSIYLIHCIVFLLCKMLYKQTGFFWSPDVAIFGQVLIAALVGIGFYKGVEKPLLKYMQKGMSTKAQVEVRTKAITA